MQGSPSEEEEKREEERSDYAGLLSGGKIGKWNRRQMSIKGGRSRTAASRCPLHRVNWVCIWMWTEVDNSVSWVKFRCVFLCVGICFTHFQQQTEWSGGLGDKLEVRSYWQFVRTGLIFKIFPIRPMLKTSGLEKKKNTCTSNPLCTGAAPAPPVNDFKVRGTRLQMSPSRSQTLRPRGVKSFDPVCSIKVKQLVCVWEREFALVRICVSF